MISRADLAEHYSDDDLLGEKWIFFVNSLAEIAIGISPTSSLSRKRRSKAHLKHLMEKLGATDRTQAGVRRGIINL
jgi:hypothetical protein